MSSPGHQICTNTLNDKSRIAAMIGARKVERSLSEKAKAAFRQAARKVVEIAEQSGTPIIVWEDNQIKELSPHDFATRHNGAAESE